MAITVSATPILYYPSPADPTKIRVRFLLTATVPNPDISINPFAPATIDISHGWNDTYDAASSPDPITGDTQVGGVEYDFPLPGSSQFSSIGNPTLLELRAEIRKVAVDWKAKIKGQRGASNVTPVARVTYNTGA